MKTWIVQVLNQKTDGHVGRKRVRMLELSNKTFARELTRALHSGVFWERKPGGFRPEENPWVTDDGNRAIFVGPRPGPEVYSSGHMPTRVPESEVLFRVQEFMEALGNDPVGNLGPAKKLLTAWGYIVRELRT